MLTCYATDVALLHRTRLLLLLLLLQEASLGQAGQMLLERGLCEWTQRGPRPDLGGRKHWPVGNLQDGHNRRNGNNENHIQRMLLWMAPSGLKTPVDDSIMNDLNVRVCSILGARCTFAVPKWRSQCSTQTESPQWTCACEHLTHVTRGRHVAHAFPETPKQTCNLMRRRNSRRAGAKRLRGHDDCWRLSLRTRRTTRYSCAFLCVRAFYAHAASLTSASAQTTAFRMLTDSATSVQFAYEDASWNHAWGIFLEYDMLAANARACKRACAVCVRALHACVRCLVHSRSAQPQIESDGWDACPTMGVINGEWCPGVA